MQKPSAPELSELVSYKPVYLQYGDTVSKKTCSPLSEKLASFFSRVLGAMDTAIKIAPNLREIIAAITKKCNGTQLSEKQIELLKPDLLAFQRKLIALKIIPRPIITLSDNIQLDTIVSSFMSAITDLNTKMEVGVAHPLLLNTMVGRGQCKIEPACEELLKNSESHFTITELLINHSPNPIVPQTNANIVSRIIDDAILGLCRITPTRKLGISGTLILRDVLPFQIMRCEEMTKQEIDAIPHYEIIEATDSISDDAVYIYQFTPKSTVFNDSAANYLYGKDVKDLTVYDLYKMNDIPFLDQNFGSYALWNKLCGSAVSSVNQALELMIVIGEVLFVKNDIKTSYRERFVQSHLPDMMDIVQMEKMEVNVKSGLTPMLLDQISKKICVELEMIQKTVKYFGSFEDEINSLFGKEELLSFF